MASFCRASWRRYWPSALRSRPVVVDFFHLQGVFLDKVAAGFHFLAHEGAEHLVGFESVVELDAQQGALFGIKGGFPELLGVHFTQALEAGEGEAALSLLADFADKHAEMRQDMAGIAVLQDEARRRLAAGHPRRGKQIGSA